MFPSWIAQLYSFGDGCCALRVQGARVKEVLRLVQALVPTLPKENRQGQTRPHPSAYDALIAKELSHQ